EGVIVDTVFYNNLSAMNGSITHTGDATDGTSDGVDESVWIQLALVPEQVWGIIFVVCAFSKGSRLKDDVKNGRVVLMEGTCLNRLQSFRIEDSVANADVVGLVKRTREGGWAFKDRELTSPPSSAPTSSTSSSRASATSSVPSFLEPRPSRRSLSSRTRTTPWPACPPTRC
ncbi:unnamed protein product, partial [Prorocentrum cordatum]